MDPQTPLEHFLVAHPERNWNWDALPSNPGIRPEFVLGREFWGTWDGIPSSLYENPNVTPQWIQDHPDIPVDWNMYSGNKSLTLEFIRDNLDKPWNWVRLSLNPVITPAFVEETLDHPLTDWRWGTFGLSSNPSMTYEFVAKYIDMGWNFPTLSKTTLRDETEAALEEMSRTRIQRRTRCLRKSLMRKTWHPSRFQEWCLDEKEKEELYV